jgi:hypothetical protein
MFSDSPVNTERGGAHCHQCWRAVSFLCVQNGATFGRFFLVEHQICIRSRILLSLLLYQIDTAPALQHGMPPRNLSKRYHHAEIPFDDGISRVTENKKLGTRQSINCRRTNVRLSDLPEKKWGTMATTKLATIMTAHNIFVSLSENCAVHLDDQCMRWV